MGTTSPGSPGMIVREVDGELLVLDTASNHIHQLNRTASIVWRMCREGADPPAIAAALAADFTVDEALALADVQQTLQQLASLNLLSARA
ncbi:PqqD family protein [Azohydromonas caseinilytica]|uniref:PqqD family protein n=1 Tax=Azohydromonas caseinilytica TaxID=2728836 RepID=A0A848FEB9_9BURK|nr:PqqD family protein [Azohydromonas caseinilytica]NML16623.1 PqqD family protein [Azohydromonas caseinilytica]